MKKRLIAVAVATLMFVQLTACGADAESSSNGTKENGVVQEVESTQESGAVQEVESNQENSAVQDSSEDAPKQEVVICTFEDIEPITMVATTWGNAYYDPNYIAEYEPENYPYLSTGGNYEAGYEFTFDQKATYEGVEYYSCLFGGGVPGASQFRMLLKASDFVPVENKEMAGNGKQIISATTILHTNDYLYVGEETGIRVDTITEYEYGDNGYPLYKIDYELIDSQKGSEYYRVRYEYDTKGNLVKELKGHVMDDSYSDWYVYEYDENGNRIKMSKYRLDVPVYASTESIDEATIYSGYVKYDYDENGRMSASYNYNKNDELTLTSTYEYNIVQTDETGSYIEEVKTYGDGKLVAELTVYYVYDANDNLLSFARTSKCVTDYEYDENGNKINATVYSGGYYEGKMSKGTLLGSVTYEYAE